INAGVDFQIRETFESAVSFGEAALRAIGVPEDEAAQIAGQVRRLDAERFELEIASNDTRAGIPLLLKNTAADGGNVPQPTPFTAPRREGRRLDEDGPDAGEARATTPDAGSSATE